MSGEHYDLDGCCGLCGPCFSPGRDGVHVTCEGWPCPAVLAAEALRDIPPVPSRRGGAGMLRLEMLLLRVRKGSAA